MSLKLFAHEQCWDFKYRYPDDWRHFGCGPGKVGNWIVPNKIVFLSVREACRIHDWYYSIWDGETEDDRHQADRIFLNNMLRIIVARTNRLWLAKLRCRIAYIYYRAVNKYGALAFYEDRNPNSEYRDIPP